MKKVFYTFLGLLILCTYARGQEESNDHLFNKAERYLYAPNQSKEMSNKIINQLMQLAENDNPKALYYLGLYQKDGVGLKQNFKKAKRNFLKAYQLGLKEAAYPIGYFHLKGFGQLKQDYQKAFKWFKQSETKMGNHWMAKMIFFGLGKQANPERALSILNRNDILNSKTLAKQFKADKEFTTPISELKTEFTSKEEFLSNNKNISNDFELTGEWSGEYIQYDWSKTKILQKYDIAIDINNDNIDNYFKVDLTISDSTYSTTALRKNNQLIFEDLIVPLKKQYTDYTNFTHLKHLIKDISLSDLESNFIVGDLNSYIPVWKENALPSIFVLKKKQSTELSRAEESFREQSNDFIKTYPNPILDYLFVNFKIEKNANIKVELTNHYNTPNFHDEIFNGYMNKGTHTIELNNLPRNQGMYLLKVTVGNTTHTKIVIK